ncbi:hypothetical protein CLU79DRAFT_885467 [Phycomyces nitens]|nr:hypothetical protein CLU79DRAFT_885467 [Phycomyces nitens]
MLSPRNSAINRVRYRFIDMNDPNRYQTIKVSKACDHCRRRKSKCDLGVPGSGTCTNCKRAHTVCSFSSVTTPRKKVAKKSSGSKISQVNTLPTSEEIQQVPIKHMDHQASTSQLAVRVNECYAHYPLLHINHAGHVNYELHYVNPCPDAEHILSQRGLSILEYTYHLESSPSRYSFEHMLVESYFERVHPSYPILHRSTVLHMSRTNYHAIFPALRYAILAVSCYLESEASRNQDMVKLSAYFYHQSKTRIDSDHRVNLSVAQTLLLLYKYNEIITPAGTCLPTSAFVFMSRVNIILEQIGSLTSGMSSDYNSLVSRTHWVFYANLCLSNLAELRWSNMLKKAYHPIVLPSALEADFNDPRECQEIADFVQLLKISILYSQVQCFMNSTSNESAALESAHSSFAAFEHANGLWMESLPVHLSANFESLEAFEPSEQLTSKSSIIFYLHILHNIIQMHSIINSKQDNTSSRLFTLSTQTYHYVSLFYTKENKGLVQSNRIVAYALALAFQAYLSVILIEITLANDEGSSPQPIPHIQWCSNITQLLCQLVTEPHLGSELKSLHENINSGVMEVTVYSASLSAMLYPTWVDRPLQTSFDYSDMQCIKELVVDQYDTPVTPTSLADSNPYIPVSYPSDYFQSQAPSSLTQQTEVSYALKHYCHSTY